MAMRVLNPVIGEFRSFRASPSAVGRSLPCARQLNRVKRDLFGAGSAATETSNLFNEELQKHQERATKKWGFDFCAGVPAQSTSQFVWERVSFQESNFVPEMYTLTRAAHVRPQPADSTSYDVLMDERSERENLAGILPLTDDSCDDEPLEELPLPPPPITVFQTHAVVAHPTKVNGRDLSMRCGGGPTLRKRQPKITEYMKERKRLSQTPRKASPAKRMRTSSGSNGAHTPHTLTSHFTLRSSLQRHL